MLALLGLPALGALIGGLIVKLVSFFATNIAKKLIIVAVVFTGFTVALAALISMAQSLLVNVVSSMGSLGIVPMFLPTNLGICLSAIISLELALTAYRLAVRFLSWKLTMLAG